MLCHFDFAIQKTRILLYFFRVKLLLLRSQKSTVSLFIETADNSKEPQFALFQHAINYRSQY